jgi:hypothetical protein
MRAEPLIVDPDPGRASDFLAQAKRFLADAEISVHQESAVILYWQACISAMDAILAVEGLAIGPGEESHVVRVEAARGAVGKGYADLFERLDEWRRDRHAVSYAAVRPPAAAAASMQADARDIVAVSETHGSLRR